MKIFRPFFLLPLLLLLHGCDNSMWNSPYPAAQSGKNILYSAFTERPKHLDPVQSYSENEAVFTAQIYMPPLQYHYLKRPYELIPFGATEMPRAQFFETNDKLLPENVDAKNIAYSIYEIHIRPGVYYQPHPAFAVGQDGKPLNQNLTEKDLKSIFELRDFKTTGTRELVAEDYVYQIKRLAHPHLHSPIYGLMSEYVMGLKDYSAKIQKAAKSQKKGSFVDLNQFAIDGVSAVDRYTYRVKIKGKYPQFLYWLAMPFFAPMPIEAERFYAQPGMLERNLTLDWYPVGTGPYMLTVNDPNRQMVLERNPNFKGEPYPAEGEADDAAKGLLADAGKLMPFIDTVVFSLEKETIPYWNKFLQGYYDASGITSDSFDQTIQFGGNGEVTLTDDMRKQDIKLQTSVATSVFYMGFNMQDALVGGTSERSRKLRMAISIALDQEEYISIFANGRGIASQGPIPPGIFGYVDGKDGINPYLYDWVNNQPQRKPVSAAKQLLVEAGYPNGRDAKTGEPLLVYLDTTLTGVGGKSRVDWLKKQFEKIDVQLVVRNTDYNRFQDKIRKGTAQLFYFGWNADYPDPENFLFLLYGPEGKLNKDGQNSANYDNAEYNRLFEQMKHMENGPARQAVINRMVEIVRHDAPWVWGFHPKDYSLTHGWVFNRKPNHMANNGLKYQRVDAVLREQKRSNWNHPVVWPVVLLILLLIAVVIPAILAYRRRESAVSLHAEERA